VTPWDLILVLIGLAGLMGLFTGTAHTRRRKRKGGPGVVRAAVEGAELQQEDWIARGIVGTARGELAKRFGPPVVASGGDYWIADTWYYPVDQGRKTGLAIKFRENVANEVEFIHGPETSSPSK
jgi:hypothetical protein